MHLAICLFMHTINDESLEWLKFGESAFEESRQNKVWQIYCSSNTMVTNWQIKICRIPSIRQICHYSKADQVTHGHMEHAKVREIWGMPPQKI